jgi:hypothetical protein
MEAAGFYLQSSSRFWMIGNVCRVDLSGGGKEREKHAGGRRFHRQSTLDLLMRWILG